MNFVVDNIKIRVPLYVDKKIEPSNTYWYNVIDESTQKTSNKVKICRLFLWNDKRKIRHI